MDDPNAKSLRERLDELLRRARQISAEIERRVEKVTAEPEGAAPPALAETRPAADAIATTAEPLPVMAESGGEVPAGPPTTVVPEARVAVAAEGAAAAAPAAESADVPEIPGGSNEPKS
jgi:hypothetical protein